MSQGDKSKYTDKQKRKAEHLEKGYEENGISAKVAERRAYKQDGGCKKSQAVQAIKNNLVPLPFEL